MKFSDIKCRKCGQDASQAGDRGAYLTRVSPKGGELIMECTPSCNHNEGNHEDALLRSLQEDVDI